MSFPRWDELWRHWDKREIWLRKKNYFLHKFSSSFWKLNWEAQHSREWVERDKYANFPEIFFIVHRDSFTLHFNSRKFFALCSKKNWMLNHPSWEPANSQNPHGLLSWNMKYFMQLIQHSSRVWCGKEPTISTRESTSHTRWSRVGKEKGETHRSR